MDNKKLIDFCKINPYAFKLILALAEEYKPKNETKVYEAVSILDAYEISVTYSQIVALFRQLEKVGVGTFFVGRKGKRSRFYWTIDIKAVGKALEESAAGAIPSSKVSVPIKEVAPVHVAASLRHPFHLREDFELVLSLPADLTDREAQRIAKFVESLPQ
jgi:hypothetical protein